MDFNRLVFDLKGNANLTQNWDIKAIQNLCTSSALGCHNGARKALYMVYMN